jgi:hypothetical protein
MAVANIGVVEGMDRGERKSCISADCHSSLISAVMRTRRYRARPNRALD